jgi:hypothetical protein
LSIRCSSSSIPRPINTALQQYRAAAHGHGPQLAIVIQSRRE